MAKRERVPRWRYLWLARWHGERWTSGLGAYRVNRALTKLAGGRMARAAKRALVARRAVLAR